MRTRIGSSWKNPQSVNAKIGGTWKESTDGFAKINGVWKRFSVKPLQISYSSQFLDDTVNSPTIPVAITGGNQDSTKTFSITSGTLPTNCSLNSSTGAIVGPTSWNYPAQLIPITYPNTRVMVSNSNGDLFGYINSSFLQFQQTNEDQYVTFGNLLYPRKTAGVSYVSKMNSSGTWQWLAYSTTGEYSFNHIEPTSDGGCVVIGLLSSGHSFSFGSISLSTISPSGQVPFIGKISSSGVWQWVTRLATNAATSATIAFVSVAPSGDIYIGGTYTTAITIGTTAYSGQSNTNNFFVAKYNSSGVLTNHIIFSGAGQESIQSIKAVSDGLIVIGVYSSSITLGSTTLTHSGSQDLFIGKLNTSLSWSWAQRAGSSGADYWNFSAGSYLYGSNHIALLSDGSFLVGGTFSGTISVAGTNLTASGTGSDGFCARFSSSGSLIWAIRAGSTNGNSPGGDGIVSPYGPSLSTSPIVAVVTGQTTPSIGSTSLTAKTNNQNSAVAKINENGSIAWTAQFSSTSVGVTIFNIINFADGSAMVCGQYTNGSLVVGSFTLGAATGGVSRQFIATVNSSGTWTSAYSPAGKAWSAGYLFWKSPSSAHWHMDMDLGYPSQSLTATYGSITFPIGSYFGGIYGILASYTTGGVLGDTSSPGFPATVTISCTDGVDSASTTTTIKQGKTRIRGGVVFSDATYYYHVFVGSSSFVVNDSNLSVSVLCVAGGGGASDIAEYLYAGGGGGGGGVTTGSYTLNPGSYSVVVGAGGKGGYATAANGGNSSFGALLSATGGGRGGDWNASNAGSGGSGGGGGRNRPAGTGTSGQGFNGAAGNGNGAGGGGGAGSSGTSSTSTTSPGNGGAATTAYSSWASATATGFSNAYAGGGAAASNIYSQMNGSVNYLGVPGTGAGIHNQRGGVRTSGGGGSAGYNYATGGGSGTVIVRYLRSAVGG